MQPKKQKLTNGHGLIGGTILRGSEIVEHVTRARVLLLRRPLAAIVEGHDVILPVAEGGRHLDHLERRLAVDERPRWPPAVHRVGGAYQLAVVVIATLLATAADRWPGGAHTVHGAEMAGVALFVEHVALLVGSKTTFVQFRLPQRARTTKDGGGKVFQAILAIEPTMAKVFLPPNTILLAPIFAHQPTERHRSRPFGHRQHLVGDVDADKTKGEVVSIQSPTW